MAVEPIPILPSEGGKTDNSVVPGTTNLGVLPGVATVAAPTRTEGRQVALSTNLLGELRVTGGGGGTEYADKAAFTEGSSGGVKPAGAVYNDTITLDPTEDQITPLRITSKKGLHTNLRNASGTEIGTSGAPVRTDPTGTTTQPVSGTVTSNAGVNLNTSALALETTLSAVKTAVELIDNMISGSEAQVDVLTMPTTTVQYAAPADLVNGAQTLTTTGDVAVIAAGGGSLRNYITSISASNTSATNVRVDFKDGVTVVASFFLAANGGGVAFTMPSPIKGTATTAFNAALSGAVTDVRVSAQGFRAN